MKRPYATWTNEELFELIELFGPLAQQAAKELEHRMMKEVA